jgi:hypothetical protein
MAAHAVPRYLVDQVLALMGLGGGNNRALANAEGTLDRLHRAREQVDALEVRMAHVAPARCVERGAGRGRTSVQPIMSRLL